MHGPPPAVNLCPSSQFVHQMIHAGMGGHVMRLLTPVCVLLAAQEACVMSVSYFNLS